MHTLRVMAVAMLLMASSVGHGSELTDMLNKMSNASLTRNYQGTFILRKADALSTLHVIHGMDERGVWESLESLNGESRKVIRQNNKVISIYPEKKILTVRDSHSEKPFHPQLPENIEQLESYYALQRLSDGRIAGYPTLVLDLKPKDGFRYGYRYWLSKDTGMLLRCDVFDDKQAILEQMMFTDLEYLDQTPKMAFTEVALKAYTIKTFDNSDAGVDEPAVNERPSWRVMQPPKGFKLSQRHYRELPSGLSLLQLVYSDGLASVSVFIEKVSADAQHLVGASSRNAIHAFGVQLTEHHVTVVGEVPAATVHEMAQSTRQVQ